MDYCECSTPGQAQQTHDAQEALLDSRSDLMTHSKSEFMTSGPITTSSVGAGMHWQHTPHACLCALVSLLPHQTVLFVRSEKN